MYQPVKVGLRADAVFREQITAHRVVPGGRID